MATPAAAATTTSNAFIALPRLAVDEFALKDLADRRIEEAVEAADRIELAHIDIFAGHAGRIDVTVDHLPHHRRNDADHGEEGKRPQVGDAGLAHGRRPADRPRHHRTDKHAVNLALFGGRRID